MTGFLRSETVVVGFGQSAVQRQSEFAMANTKVSKTAYEAPELTVHGALEDLTQGGSVGSALDAAFPVGTPFGDLTFS